MIKGGCKPRDVGGLVVGTTLFLNALIERRGLEKPDVLSLGLGGGSVSSFAKDISVGPQSVGYRILEEVVCVGGDTLTATDSGRSEFDKGGGSAANANGLHAGQCNRSVGQSCG